MASTTVLVTTAARKRDLLSRTISELRAAGFEDLLLVAEPPFNSSKLGCHENNVRISLNDCVLGPYRNWRNALQLACQQDSQFVVLAQDDLLVRPNIRNYLEATVRDPKAVYSAYLSAKDAKTVAKSTGNWRVCKSGWNYCGALFFMMTVEMAQWLHGVMPSTVANNRAIDAHVAKVLSMHKRTLYVHYPSLVEHTGDDCSTVGHKPDSKIRMAYGFEH